MMSHLKRLIRDRRGVTAIEFALIAPAVILVYFATTQLIVAMAAERRASHVASSIADLVAQNATMTVDQLTAIMRVGPSIMEPFPAATPDPLQMRITSVVVNATTQKPTVTWSRGDGMSALTPGTIVSDFPAELLVDTGGAFVMGEVTYSFKPTLSPAVLKSIFPPDGSWKFDRKFYLRPRRGAEVLCSDCPK